MRRVMALVLLAVLLVSSIPVQAQAAYENTYTNTGDQRADIIGVALTQVGYQEGKGTGQYNNDTKYGDWAGWPGTEWCGWFVSWCADQANVPKSVIPKNGRASPSGFGYSTCYTSDQYTPRPGDLFFKKGHTHVGLVYYVEGSYFYTLEGNTSTSGWEGHSVMIRRRALNEFCFVSPRYSSDSGSSLPPAHTHSYQKSFESSHPHKEIARCACGNSYYTGETRTVADCPTCKAQNCDHSYGSWKDYNSSNHHKVCSKCGTSVTQSHSWVDVEVTKEPTCKEKGSVNQKCSVCNRTRTQSIAKLDEHSYKDWIVQDSQKHMRVCEFCDDKQEAPHEVMLDPEKQPVFFSDDKSHWNQCADCGMRIEAQEHELEKGSDDTNHWQACKLCQRIVNRQTHIFDHGCDTDCSDCGYVRATQHTYDKKICADETDHWYACVNCDHIVGKQVHQYQMVPWEDDAQVESCVFCGHLSGKVIEPSDWLKLAKFGREKVTWLGDLITPVALEGRWYHIIGGSAVVLALAILILVPSLIVHGAKKRKKKKAEVQ